MKLLSSLIHFRSTVMKSFRIDFDHEVDETNDVINVENDKIIISISSIQQNLSKNQDFAIDKNNQSTNSSIENFTLENSSLADKSIQNRCLLTRYQNFVNVIVLL